MIWISLSVAAYLKKPPVFSAISLRSLESDSSKKHTIDLF